MRICCKLNGLRSFFLRSIYCDTKHVRRAGIWSTSVAHNARKVCSIIRWVWQRVCIFLRLSTAVLVKHHASYGVSFINCFLILLRIYNAGCNCVRALWLCSRRRVRSCLLGACTITARCLFIIKVLIDSKNWKCNDKAYQPPRRAENKVSPTI